MQTTTKNHRTRLLALVLMLVMLVGAFAVNAMAASCAKPDKITLVGSEDALEYEHTGTFLGRHGSV